MRKILCLLGWHVVKITEVWVPSIDAEVVTEHVHFGTCVHCGKTVFDYSSIWDEKSREFI